MDQGEAVEATWESFQEDTTMDDSAVALGDEDDGDEPVRNAADTHTQSARAQESSGNAEDVVKNRDSDKERDAKDKEDTHTRDARTGTAHTAKFEPTESRSTVTFNTWEDNDEWDVKSAAQAPEEKTGQNDAALHRRGSDTQERSGPAVESNSVPVPLLTEPTDVARKPHASTGGDQPAAAVPVPGGSADSVAHQSKDSSTHAQESRPQGSSQIHEEPQLRVEELRKSFDQQSKNMDAHSNSSNHMHKNTNRHAQGMDGNSSNKSADSLAKSADAHAKVTEIHTKSVEVQKKAMEGASTTRPGELPVA